MDQDTLSQAFGYCALALRIGGTYLQSRFPGAHMMKKTVIPIHALTSLSYMLNNNIIPAIAYASAAARNGVLITKAGQKIKHLVTGINIGICTAATAALYEQPGDLLALAGTGAATLGDYQNQGRYQRLPYMAARLLIWPAMAYYSDNKAMLITELVSCGIQAHTIYKHDIKKASGLENAGLTKDFAAYCHGILKNSATGASIEGQVDTSAGRNDAQEQYAHKVKNAPNPNFLTQNQIAAHL